MSHDQTPADPTTHSDGDDATNAAVERFIERALADAPPITDTQRERIARILSGGNT